MTLDQLQQWLMGQGFIIAPNPLRNEMNNCAWIAYRRNHQARDCECNDKPPSTNITPFDFNINGHHIQSVEITLTGQCDEWFKLQAYSISYNDLKTKLDEVELKLVRAWNALEGEG